MTTLLFDNDGTLVDSEWLCNQALATILAQAGVVVDVGLLVRDYRGGKLTEIFSQLASRFAVQLPADSEAQYRRLVSDLFAAQLRPIAGVMATLDWATAAGMQLAVVSNGPQTKIRQALQICGLSHYFADRVFSGYDINCFKPDGGLYQYASAALGTAPAHCIVIEDSVPGIKAGLAAGCRTVFLNRYQEIKPDPAVIEVTTMAQLPAILQTLTTPG
jgi:HAD superfamily hydrolase (TIGR01509 family)